MALVNHYEGVILLCQVADLVHRSDVSVHTEHSVSNDDAESLSLGLLETTLQVFHIGICVAVAYGFAETHTVNDGGVVERIGYDGVFRSEKGLEYTSVCIEAACIENGVIRMEIVSNSLFKLLMQILLATDEPY